MKNIGHGRTLNTRKSKYYNRYVICLLKSSNPACKSRRRLLFQSLFPCLPCHSVAKSFFNDELAVGAAYSLAFCLEFIAERVDLAFLQNGKVAIRNRKNKAGDRRAIQFAGTAAEMSARLPDSIAARILGVGHLRLDQQIARLGIVFLPGGPADLIEHWPT